MADHGQELSLKNELYAAGFDKGHLPLPPSKKLVVGKYIYPIYLMTRIATNNLLVTCMDARIEYIFKFC
jgi:hypothetical protein